MNGFIDAALAGPSPLIMEIKRKDADGADLLHGRSVPDVLAAYQRAGAQCLSVVTGHWFGGDQDLLREVRGLTGLPILQKDFITRRGQLESARKLGVSAVLLTAQLLPAKGLNNLADQALELGLVPFIEVVSAQEITSIENGADVIIAVNNKDIRGKEKGSPDLARSERLIKDVEATGCRCPVSASGVDSPAAAMRLLGAGYRALLVGTALLAGQDLGDWEAVTSGAFRSREPA